MFLTDVADINIGQAGVYGLLGYAMVFFGLILLMIVMILLGKCFSASAKKPAAMSAAPASPTPAAEISAPGSAGHLKLHNVEPKTAAMLMAIVADKLGKPVNELRFLSIQEVDE